MGRFVGRVGSARYVSDIDYAAGRLTLRVPVQYESDIDALRFEGTMSGDRIEGTTLAANGNGGAVHGDARAGARAGVEAEVARRDAAPERPRSHGLDAAQRGARRLLAHGGRCADRDAAVRRSRDATRRSATFACTRNSGSRPAATAASICAAATRCRSKTTRARRSTRCAWAASMASSRRPSLPRVQPASGSRSTSSSSAGASPSRLNGTTIIDGQEIPGITGGALDSDEGEPGPIMLQGDHGAIEFRNLTIAPCALASYALRQRLERRQIRREIQDSSAPSSRRRAPSAVSTGRGACLPSCRRAAARCSLGYGRASSAPSLGRRGPRRGRPCTR